jgi:hypothetical protein
MFIILFLVNNLTNFFIPYENGKDAKDGKALKITLCEETSFN